MGNNVNDRYNELLGDLLKEKKSETELKCLSLAAEGKEKLEELTKESFEYSIEELKAIEEVLETTHKKYIKGDPNDTRYTPMCFAIGCYIGEIIREIKGGIWKADDKGIPYLEMTTENGTFNVHIVIKVARRVTIGKIEDVKGFVKQVLAQ